MRCLRGRFAQARTGIWNKLLDRLTKMAERVSANPFAASALVIVIVISVEPFALKSFEMSASLSSRASAAGEISVRCATRVSASAESRTRSWRGSSLPALLSLPAIQSSPFSSCIGIVVPDSTSRTLTGGYPTVASLLERHASITMSRVRLTTGLSASKTPRAFPMSYCAN